jgi:hypothetical protein
MKFSMEEFDSYSPELTGYFSLKNDGDTCRVRFMYESMNDLEGHCVHKVNLRNGGFRFVDCLRSYDEPAENCPLCSSPNTDDRKLQSKIWVPIYKVETGEAVLWERGKSFYKNTLYPLMVEKGKPFCGNIFTIERHGAAGDMSTTYEVVFESFDDTVLDDFDEIPNPADNIILSKTYEELEKFVKTRTFDDDSSPDIFKRGSSNTVAGADSDGIRPRRGISRPTTTD